MGNAEIGKNTTVDMLSIRQELMRAQLRPVIALALAAAAFISLLLITQYTWLRLQATNPLDEIEVQDLRQVLRNATPEQWPVLVRWIAVYGLAMTVDETKGVPSGYARLPDGQQVRLSQVVSIIVAGQNGDVSNGQYLRMTNPPLQKILEQISDQGSRRLTASEAANTGAPPGWPALLIRLDAERVMVLSSPDYSMAAGDLTLLVLSVFGAVGVGYGVFMALFLFFFRRNFADRSAERLSAPIQRLSVAVKEAAAERDARRRVLVEPPVEVAQLATNFNLMQEHLAQVLTEREQVINSQRELVTMLAHELRTPLTVLRGHAEVLERADETSTPARVMLSQIEDLHRLLSDLLDMARLESIEATLVTEQVRLDVVVEEMLQRFAAAAWRHGVLLRRAQQSETGVVVWADTRWLRQMVANLLSNAIRHTPQGGLVTLAVQSHVNHAQLLVEDTGVGLGAVKVTNDVVERAAGVGLVVVRRLAQAMRGSLALHTNEHGGTSAILKLKINMS